MRVKIKKQVLSFLLCATLIGNIFPVNSVAADKDMYALTYHVGAYDMFPENDGSISVMIDGKKYYYSDDFDDGEISTKISGMENQNVVYELHENKIVKVYTMDEVLSQEVTVEPSVKDGIIYRKGKFSQKSFDLVVKVSNNLQGDFKKNDLLWFLSKTEKDCLYSTLKKLEIKPSNEVDFGSFGWWMWKEYEKTISENVNDVIKAEETKEYKYTVNLHKDGVENQKEYNIILYATPTFDTGVGRRVEGKIPVGNLDYQEEKTEEKKKTSNSGKSVTQATVKLDGIQNAMQFSNNYFSATQIEQINEFVNLWISELLLAKYLDKSDLKEKVSEKVSNELLKKLGLDTSILAIPGEIRATTYLETQTKDGTDVLIQFEIKLLNFDFGNSGMPTMATGSGEATIYNMDGKELDSSIILPAYADVCTFCEQLQKVATDTILNGAKEYLGIFGISTESTAEALSSQMMAKVLNNKYAKDAFKMIDAKDVKKVLEKIIVDGEKTVNKKIFKLITTPSQGSTEVSVKCPVDVKIYDNDGNLCGIVKGNTVDSTFDDIFVNVVGDQKNIYLVGDDYSFEMTGTDDGSMDYVVREFDEEGNTTREITYEKIKLSNGCKYYSYVPEAENHSNVLFDLTDREGNVVLPTTGEDKDIYVTVNGTCGDNVYWELSDDDILRIWGNGTMYDFDYWAQETAPWQSYSHGNSIKNIIIEDGVVSIGEDAFFSCHKVTNVEISDSVQKIGSSAFAHCENMAKIKIPDAVESIGNNTFEDCSSLEKLLLPESLKTIGQGVFYGCDDLKTAGPIGGNYNIEFGWKSAIPNNAFRDCSSLEKLLLPESLKTIGQGIFYGCDNLKTAGPIGGNYNIEFGWKSAIPDNAFRDCSSLEKLLLPESIKVIGQGVFYGCDDLKTAGPVGGNYNIEFGWKGEIPDNAFKRCSSLEYIDIPETITRIGNYSFFCSGLKNIELTKNILEIGEYAFAYCGRLEHIYYDVIRLQENREAEYTSKYIFADTGNKTSHLTVTIGDDVTDIPDYGFWQAKIKNLKIGKNVEYIGIGAFYLGGSCKEIYYNAKHVIFCAYNDPFSDRFWGSPFGGIDESGLELIFGDDVEYIPDIFGTKHNMDGDYTHDYRHASGDFSVKKIILGKNIQTINNSLNVFQDLEGFEVSQENDYFSSKDGILYDKEKETLICYPAKKENTNFQIPDSVISIGEYAFDACSKLTEVIIPKGISSIGEYAFCGCSGLKSITLPEGMTNIGECTFRYCSKMTNVTIPISIKSIEWGAFMNCVELKDAYYAGSEAEWKKIDTGVSYVFDDSVKIHYSSTGIDTATSPQPTKKPDVTASLNPTYKPNATENPKPANVINETRIPTKGTLLKDNKNKMSYKVITQNKTVEFYKVNNQKATKVVVPTTVTIDGTKYRVTALSDNAFSGCKNIESVTISRSVAKIGNKAFFKCASLKKIIIPVSVTKIGNKAFYGCKKLKSITIKTRKLKNKSVGVQAFKGIHKKATIKVPKKLKKAYQKWLRKKGITKKMKIK